MKRKLIVGNIKIEKEKWNIAICYLLVLVRASLHERPREERISTL